MNKNINVNINHHHNHHNVGGNVFFALTYAYNHSNMAQSTLDYLNSLAARSGKLGPRYASAIKGLVYSYSHSNMAQSELDSSLIRLLR